MKNAAHLLKSVQRKVIRENRLLQEELISKEKVCAKQPSLPQVTRPKRFKHTEEMRIVKSPSYH